MDGEHLLCRRDLILAARAEVPNHRESQRVFDRRTEDRGWLQEDRSGERCQREYRLSSCYQLCFLFGHYSFPSNRTRLKFIRVACLPTFPSIHISIDRWSPWNTIAASSNANTERVLSTSLAASKKGHRLVVTPILLDESAQERPRGAFHVASSRTRFPATTSKELHAAVNGCLTVLMFRPFRFSRPEPRFCSVSHSLICSTAE